MTAPWWDSFFDDDYARVFDASLTPARTAREVDGLLALLAPPPNARILDAPCGYGRITRPLAERGFRLVGVDRAQPLLDRAEQARGALTTDRLRYVHQDLRAPLVGEDASFDVALNLFSSIGYGSEDDDRAAMTTIARALKPGGKLLIDTMHRDVVAAFSSHGFPPPERLPDGTIFMEQPRLDVITGRVENNWYWQGPNGGGTKSASIRIYTIGELIALVEHAGLRFVSIHRGCSPEPFVASGSNMGGRVGLVAVKA
ncbi:MAG TPA: class I SAM-dependent methyltransferase [Polyangia bacterium]|nr:class I SAM-dependent methyltransferase [Polyangia bacterium]